MPDTEEMMKIRLKWTNRIIAMFLAIVMVATFLPNVNGANAVYASEIADSENDDMMAVQSRPGYDVVHFKVQDENGNEIPECTDDVIQITTGQGVSVERIVDGYEFSETDVDNVEFTVAIKDEYQGIYELISAGNNAAEEGICTITEVQDEQIIPVVVKACAYEISAQVNIGGVSYGLTDEKGRSIEEGKTVCYGENFTFKLKSNAGFYNNSIDVTVAEKGGEKQYQLMPNKKNVYTIEGEKIRGSIVISQEIEPMYGDVRYTGGFFCGDWAVPLDVSNVYLVSVPQKTGEEPQKYSELSVPQGTYKLELKDDFAKKYKLTNPEKTYKVVKNKTTDIDATIEPNDELHRFDVYFESELKIVNVSITGNTTYAEINDDAELAYKKFLAGDDYKKLSVYGDSGYEYLNIAIDEAFKEKYEIKSVKYKGTDTDVEVYSEGVYALNYDTEYPTTPEICVVVGAIKSAVVGEFNVGIDGVAQKYIGIDSVKTSKEKDAEELTLNDKGKYEIPEGTEHIYISVKSNDCEKVPIGSIAYKINGVDSQVFVIDYDDENGILCMAVDTTSLAGKEIEFYVRTNAFIVFDDNVMEPEFDGHSINLLHVDDASYRTATAILNRFGVERPKDTLYIYDFADSKKLNVGESIDVCIRGREKTDSGIDGYKNDYIGKDNITYYYQIFGNKTSKKNKIANPEEFCITLDQTNSVIVFTYEIKPTDRIFVSDGEGEYTENFDSVVNLDCGNKVKIASTGMSSNLSQLNVKDPSTATWKISSLNKAKSDDLLKVVKDDAVYLDVNEDTIKAIGYKQFAIERTENKQKTTWNFVINNEKPMVTVKNLDNKTIYAGQEKTYAYEVKGSNHPLTKDNVKIYKANGDPADKINIKDVSDKNITIEALAVDASTDKATYYVDIVNANGESLLKAGKKLKLNVAVLDSKFKAQNIEYVRSDEDNIYFKVKGLTAETENLYTSISITADAIVAEGETLNSLYKEHPEVCEPFKNNTVIKVPVKNSTTDDKTTTQNYRFTFNLMQKKSGGSETYKSSEVKLGTAYANRALYYETNLKIKALSASKNVYTGQRDIQIATPVFSKESSSNKVIYLKDNKGQIETNNYGDIEGNAYDPESGNLVINLPAEVTPGKHILTFEAYAPSGYIKSSVSMIINVKIGIESIALTVPSSTYYIGNKDITISPKLHYYNETHRPMYDATIKPTTCKATYRIDAKNKELLSYITINPSNGKVKISKNLSKVFDRIKSNGDSFCIFATAADYPGTEVYKPIGYVDREIKYTITLTKDGVSDYLKNNNEIRAYITTPYYNEKNEYWEKEERRDIAIIDKKNKTKTEFTVSEAKGLSFKAYRSASDKDDDKFANNRHVYDVTWKVSGPISKEDYQIFDNGLLKFNYAKPGTYTVTAVATDGSGNGSASRTFVVKKDSCKLGLYENSSDSVTQSEDINDWFVYQAEDYAIIPVNDEETGPLFEINEYERFYDKMEHNYQVKISGGVITRNERGLFSYKPTEEYTTITLINKNKGSDGKRVQQDKVYKIHNLCFANTNSDFDKVKITTAKTMANTYYEGKEPTKVRFEITKLPSIVVDKGEGHTGYYLSLTKNYKEKSKDPNPEFMEMFEEMYCSEIMTENGKYYAEYTQREPSTWGTTDLVAGTYKLDGYIGYGQMDDDNLGVLNKKPIATTLTILPNNLKATWVGGKTTKIKMDGNVTGKQVQLVAAEADTDYFKRSKNKNVAEVRITDIEYDIDTLNIFKESLVSDEKLFTASSENGNIVFTYKAENFDALKEAVIDAARGTTVAKGSLTQKAAAKMTAKPNKSGVYDMNKVNPVIKGRFTYEIVGTDAVGYERVSNLTQNFEITLTNPK